MFLGLQPVEDEIAKLLESMRDCANNPDDPSSQLSLINQSKQFIVVSYIYFNVFLIEVIVKCGMPQVSYRTTQKNKKIKINMITLKTKYNFCLGNVKHKNKGAQDNQLP